MTTVLIADDSETILLLMRTRLELAGYEVETAADGQEVTERVDPGSQDGQAAGGLSPGGLAPEAEPSSVAVLAAEIALLHARLDDLQSRLDK